MENIFQPARFAELSFYASLTMSSIYALPGCSDRDFQDTDRPATPQMLTAAYSDSKTGRVP